MSLKEALYECLQGSLSPNGDIRKAAEERLKALEVTETYGLFLMEMVLDANYMPPIRQLASVILRQYVDTHWTSITEKFVPPEPPAEVKASLRAMAPIGLKDPQSKIRNSVASVISSIAHWDWPESWPNLFDIVMANLRDEKGVQGAMRVMTEFAKEFTDQHMVQVAPFVLPEMFRILSEKNVYSVHVRSRAVQIFRTCAHMITTMSEFDKNVASSLLNPELTNFMTAFVQILSETNVQFADYGLKKDIVKTITMLLRQSPKKMAPYLPHLLQPSWGILTSSTEVFREILSGNADEPDIDSDGEQCGIESVLFSIFGLVQILIETPSSKSVVREGLADLIYYTIFYMQLPQERVESWCSNPSTFATDEDEDAATYTLRICAQDLLTLVCDEFPEECIAALGQAVNRHLQEAGQSDWRLQEACLFAVSSLGTRVATTSQKEVPSGNFDIHGFVQNVVIPGLSSRDILLVGRCLVLGSNFCNVIDQRLTENFVRAAAECLQPDRSVILKILAMKALSVYIELAKENPIIKSTLLEVLPSTVDCLINFGTTQSVEILSSVLETIVGILSIDLSFTASVGQKITTLAIACFVKFNGDPVIGPTIEDIVKVLCQSPECVMPLQERFIPTIVSILRNDSEDMGGPQGVALDLLSAIVRASPVPLSQVLMGEAFQAVVNCVANSEDHTVLQNGGECLRAFTSVSPLQVFEYRDAQGNSGLGFVVQVACRLLDPMTSEYSASLVGKLVTTLIRKTGDMLGDQLELLLRAVLSKLQSADSLSVIQNLCMVYAHLFNAQMEAALNFLDSVPGPTGQSALHFVMTEWVSRQHMFYGLFDRKVSSIALCKLLLHGVCTQDTRLAQVEVKGEQIFDPNQPQQIMTRSKRSAEQWTRIPLLVKIFKLLINELACCTVDNTEDYETESESDGDDNNKENVYGGNGGHVGDDDLYFDEESGVNIDDLDVMQDPLYSVNLEDYLKEFLQGFSAQPYYHEFLAHANTQELKVLGNSGITPSVSVPQ